MPHLNYRFLTLGVAGLLAVSACSSSAAPSNNGPSNGGAPATSAAPAATSAGSDASAAPTTDASVSASASAAPEASAGTSATPSGQTADAPGAVKLAVGKAADGSCTMPAKYQGKDFEIMPTGSAKKQIALTFDGGASNAGNEKILKVLEEKNATATFFFTGKFAEAFPEDVKKIAAKYPIGNHSYSHPNFSQLTPAQIKTELAKGEAAIEKASGGKQALPFFRFPYGDVSPQAIKAVNDNCYVPFRWTIDTLGYDGKTKGNSVEKILAKVEAKAAPSGVVLMHQGDNPDDKTILDADALAPMIDQLRADGYELVTLEQALKA